MSMPSSTIIIVLVLGLALYLIYSQSPQSSLTQTQAYGNGGYNQHRCPQCQSQTHIPIQSQPQSQLQQMPQQQMPIQQLPLQQMQHQQMPPQLGPSGQQMPPMLPQVQPQLLPLQSQPQSPNVTQVVVQNETDPYSDAIKRQDLYTMYDPLTYPQLRLPREVLERYNDYYKTTGTYPPFNEATQGYLFDNPILNGILIKIVDDNEPFTEHIPNSVPLFRVRSSTNTNRYFYYVIDNRNFNVSIQPKIPLDHVRLNGVRYNNADFYGLPEIFDEDIIDSISIYPGARFKVTLYKTYHFP